MHLSRMALRSVRSLVRAVLFPALALFLLLGLMSGGSGSVSLTPTAGRIVSELQTHKRLPTGTTLSVGKKANQLAIRIDSEGRLSITTPRSENIGGLVSTGMDEAVKLVSSGHVQSPTGLAAYSKP
jgi:hypothetical protein